MAPRDWWFDRGAPWRIPPQLGEICGPTAHLRVRKAERRRATGVGNSEGSLRDQNGLRGKPQREADMTAGHPREVIYFC